jgi:hypothetical protein
MNGLVERAFPIWVQIDNEQERIRLSESLLSGINHSCTLICVF